MSDAEEKNWRKGEALGHAWYEFMDYGDPSRPVKMRLRELRREAPFEAVERVEAGNSRYDQQTRKLQSEFLVRLLDGEFVAFGRNLSDGVMSPIKRIPAVVFREEDAEFSVRWDHDEVSAYGSRFIEVRAIAAKALEVVEPQKTEAAGSHAEFSGSQPEGADTHGPEGGPDDLEEDQLSALPEHDTPANGPGRPSHAETITDVIREKVSEFGLKWWSQAPASRYGVYRTILGRNPDLDLRRGFSDKTFQKYETEFRKRSN